MPNVLVPLNHLRIQTLLWTLEENGTHPINFQGKKTDSVLARLDWILFNHLSSNFQEESQPVDPYLLFYSLGG